MHEDYYARRDFVGHPATLVAFGGMNEQTIVFVIGLLFTGWLVRKRIQGAPVIGITGTSVFALVVSTCLDMIGGSLL